MSEVDAPKRQYGVDMHFEPEMTADEFITRYLSPALAALSNVTGIDLKITKVLTQYQKTALKIDLIK